MRKTVLILAFLSAVLVSAQDSYQQIKQLAVDKKMTDRTAKLLYTMHNPNGVLLGQHNGVWMEEHKGLVSYVSDLTGKLPTMVSHDFMFITNKKNVWGSWHRSQEHQIRENIIAADRAGIFLTMCWHYNEPYEGNTFYTQNMKNKEHVENAFRSIMEGGENHEAYKKDLRKIAEFSNTLKDDNGELIPFIFRPFHEFDGEWFWWGAPYNSPEEFKSLWKFTVNYLRDSLNVHHLLYAFSPDIRFESREDFLLRYPGDDYVDIIGFDDYEDFKYDAKRAHKAKERIKIVGELGKEKNKPAGLTEVGYFTKHHEQKEIDLQRTQNLLNVLSDAKDYLSFILFWGNGGYDYCLSPIGTIGETEFRDFLNQPFIKLIEKR